MKDNVLVGIIMGSDSDLPVMEEAAKVLDEFGVKYEITIVSAHRTPERMFDYAKSAQSRRCPPSGYGSSNYSPSCHRRTC